MVTANNLPFGCQVNVGPQVVITALNPHSSLILETATTHPVRATHMFDHASDRTSYLNVQGLKGCLR
jgi:hypothetical protein